MKMPTYERPIANEIGRKPAHADEGCGATTAYSPVAVRGAIGLRSSFLFLFGAAKRKREENNNKKQQFITKHDNQDCLDGPERLTAEPMIAPFSAVEGLE